MAGIASSIPGNLSFFCLFRKNKIVSRVRIELQLHQPCAVRARHVQSSSIFAKLLLCVIHAATGMTCNVETWALNLRRYLAVAIRQDVHGRPIILLIWWQVKLKLKIDCQMSKDNGHY